MKPLYDRRIIGIIFEKIYIDKIDFEKTIEDGTSDLVISSDGMTSIMWDIDTSGEYPLFISNIPYSRIFTRIELDYIKTLKNWLPTE